MTEAFDYSKFYDLTQDIEKYLGVLKGNELVREYDLMVKAETEDALYTIWDTPDPEYPASFVGMAIPYDPDNTDAYKDTVEKMEKNWALAFGNGAKWADGIGGYLRDMCADLTHPSAEMIKSSVQEFGDTAAALESVIPVDWTDLDFNSWIGASSDACQGVVTKFQAKFRDEYAFYFSYAQAIYAGAGVVVVQTQKGLNKTLTGIRDNLKAQCAAWQDSGGYQPEDRSDLPSWLPDLGALVGSVLDVIPGVSTVKGVLDDVAGIAGNALKLFDAEIEWTKGAFDAMTADEAYTKTTTVLQDDYMKKMKDGLDRLKTERADAVVAAQEGVHPWMMDTLEGIEDETWQHEAEA